MMDLDIFVIFHKTLYWDMYKDLEPDEFDCFKFVAVNEKLPKEWDETKFPNVIKEWELPVYDPKWQEENWANGGTNHHIIMNDLLTGEYAAFVQYDMKFPKGSIRELYGLLKRNIGVSIKTMNFVNLIGTSTYGFQEFPLYNYAISQLDALKSSNFPLYHVCFMASDHWREIQPRLLDIDKNLFTFHKRPGDPWYRFPITTERSLALACASILDDIIEFPKITHERL
jgi:hypothetical protein